MEQQPNPSAPILTIDGHLFHAKEEIDAWIQNEETFWRWVQGLEKSPQSGDLPTRLAEIFKAMKAQLGSAANNPQNIQRSFDNLVRSKKYFSSTTPQALHVDKLKDTDPKKAAQVLKYHMDPDGKGLEPLRAQFELLLFEKGIGEDIITIQTKQFEMFLSRANESLNSFVAKGTHTQQNHTNLEKQISESGQKLAEEHKQQLELQKATFEQMIKERTEKLDTLTKTYEKLLALKSPVDYWKGRARAHQIAKWCFATASLFMLLAGCAGILFTIWNLPEPTADTSETLKQWQLLRSSTTLLILCTITIWITRLLVRVYLTNLHLDLK
jgi:hypothetical protein